MLVAACGSPLSIGLDQPKGATRRITPARCRSLRSVGPAAAHLPRRSSSRRGSPDRFSPPAPCASASPRRARAPGPSAARCHRARRLSNSIDRAVDGRHVEVRHHLVVDDHARRLRRSPAGRNRARPGACGSRSRRRPCRRAGRMEHARAPAPVFG